ncbi:hypothetical protein SSSM5_127 [Synechococcus phage S-SSM5]|uniref:Uncharacterized protein n=1 Tax=Synechococcus phage S-SSM5 TaxID=445685 RepID=E3SKG7_9CAUD|nr:hypothetical protein SSSM5_127 [Synechococcus phage S-SSM5]ADO97943.1 hypothetical protein SSSM5_127 [Synechococcus phage S-SSM5]
MTEQTYWQLLVKVMRQGWCPLLGTVESKTNRVSGKNVFTSVVMPVLCWYTGIQPPNTPHKINRRVSSP